MAESPIALPDESERLTPEEHGGLTASARQDPEAALDLAPGRPLAATQSSRHVFRFGMRAFLIGSVLFSLQFLAWNLLGILFGSLVNLFLILIVTAGTIACGAIAGAKNKGHDRVWDQALVRGMLAFYLMGAIAVLAGGGKAVNDFVQARRVRYVVQERFGFTATERIAIDGATTVELIAVTDATPDGAFAQAGIVPGQAIVVQGSADDFYARLLEAESDSITLTLVPAPVGSSVARDISRLPTRRAKLDLRPAP
ncbi:MAG TPA: hypothetical protein VGN57_19620 [Pirellulaceae bacterium]|jgi:hypothetical protein|nr:hypothetical protein [Pirellulaceae bacterium]